MGDKLGRLLRGRSKLLNLKCARMNLCRYKIYIFFSSNQFICVIKATGDSRKITNEIIIQFEFQFSQTKAQTSECSVSVKTSQLKSIH